MPLINSNRIREILEDCFMQECEVEDGKPTVEFLEGRGVRIHVGLNKERTEKYRDEIREILSNLPETFMWENGGIVSPTGNAGGGMSFLNMCLDKEGNQWTDLHQRQDELIVLGNALGMVELTPLQFSPMMPGGMPYVFVNLNGPMTVEMILSSLFSGAMQAKENGDSFVEGNDTKH